MKKYFKLLRVKHYMKNALVFMPLFFSGNIFHPELLINNIIGCINFCLASSFIYVINDMNDVEKDRNHPTKCKRPLASGEISMGQAKILLGILITLIFGLSVIVNGYNLVAWGCVAVYIVINIMYSNGMKNIVLIDILILMVGYILRLYYGSFIVGVPVSSWLYLTVMSFAFYLGLGKRRNELDKNNGKNTRAVLQKYNRNFLDKNMYMCLALTIVFYALWCENIVTTGGPEVLLLSIPMVILICMRYSLLVEGESDGDPVEVVIKDKVMLACMSVFVIFMIIILYM